MERVPVKLLTPGQALEGPLYDKSQKLLLAKGNLLTREMVTSLLRAGTNFVYLGEWNAADVERYESTPPAVVYRRVAEQMAQALQSEVEQDLESHGCEVKPRGEALEQSVDHTLHTNRSEQRLHKWQATCYESVKTVEGIFGGQFEEDRVAPSVMGVVGKIVDSFSKDRSLLNNLTNMKLESEYLYTHSFNVAVLAINIATALRYDRTQVSDIGMAALLQDIGMVMISRSLIDVPRKLSPDEMLDVQKHTSLGLYSLRMMPGLPRVVRFVVYQHHERANGGGYPLRREGRWIHKFAQIVTVADVYDALTSDRPWRKAWHPYRAMEYLIRQAGKGTFEREIVRGLLRYLSLYPIGSLVRLTSGEVAKVVHSNGDAIDRPTVAILVDADGNPCSTPSRTVNLFDEKELRVAGVIEERLDIGLHAGF